MTRTAADRRKRKLVHFLLRGNWYACIRAVGNGVRGLGTKNKELVTCKNCLRQLRGKNTTFYATVMVPKRVKMVKKNER